MLTCSAQLKVSTGRHVTNVEQYGIAKHQTFPQKLAVKLPFIHVRRSEFGFEPKHRPSPLGCRSSLGVTHKEGQTIITTTIPQFTMTCFTNYKELIRVHQE